MSVFAGIDIAAKFFDLVIRRNGKSRAVERFEQTPEGHDKAARKLEQFELSGLNRPVVLDIPGAASTRLLLADEGQLITIDPETQRIEDRSQRFEGEMIPSSLPCHGDNIMTYRACPKTLFTSEAIYQYDP